MGVYLNQDSQMVKGQDAVLPTEFKDILNEIIEQCKRESRYQWPVLIIGVLAIFVSFLISFWTIFSILVPYIESNPDSAFNYSVIALTGAISASLLEIIFASCLIRKLRAPWADAIKILSEIRKFKTADMRIKAEAKERQNSKQDEGPGLQFRFLRGK